MNGASGNRLAHRGLLQAAALLAALLAGCAGSKETKPAKVSATTQRGPVQAVVEVAPASARLSDALSWTLKIVHEQGVEVTAPALGKTLGAFSVRESRPLLPGAEGEREVIRLSATLEPTRPGKLEVPPLPIAFVDRRKGAPSGRQTLETGRLRVEITSELAGGEASLDNLRPMAGPVALPPPYLLWAGGAVAGLLLTAAVAGYLMRRRRRPLPPASPPTPSELAEQELAALLASRLMERDVKRFYVELTGIVRRYIERTTGVRAAEQTTEEFLHQIRREATFPPEESGRLGRFLEAADLVKFAAHRPREEDLRESVERARAVVARREPEVAA